MYCYMFCLYTIISIVLLFIRFEEIYQIQKSFTTYNRIKWDLNTYLSV